MTDANNADEEDGRLCDGADPWELSKLLRSFVEENGEHDPMPQLIDDSSEVEPEYTQPTSVDLDGDSDTSNGD